MTPRARRRAAPRSSSEAAPVDQRLVGAQADVLAFLAERDRRRGERGYTAWVRDRFEAVVGERAPRDVDVEWLALRVGYELSARGYAERGCDVPPKVRQNLDATRANDPSRLTDGVRALIEARGTVPTFGTGGRLDRRSKNMAAKKTTNDGPRETIRSFIEAQLDEHGATLKPDVLAERVRKKFPTRSYDVWHYNYYANQYRNGKLTPTSKPRPDFVAQYTVSKENVVGPSRAAKAKADPETKAKPVAKAKAEPKAKAKPITKAKAKAEPKAKAKPIAKAKAKAEPKAKPVAKAKASRANGSAATVGALPPVGA